LRSERRKKTTKTWERKRSELTQCGGLFRLHERRPGKSLNPHAKEGRFATGGSAETEKIQKYREWEVLERSLLKGNDGECGKHPTDVWFFVFGVGGGWWGGGGGGGGWGGVGLGFWWVGGGRTFLIRMVQECS